MLAADLLTPNSTGSPTTAAAVPTAWFSASGITPPLNYGGAAFYKQTVPWKPGEVYEFDYEVEGLTGTTFATVYGGYLDASFAGTAAAAAAYVATPNGVKTRIVQRIALDRTVAGATTWTLAGTGTDRLRFGVLFGRTNTGPAAPGQSRLTRMTVRNVTGLVNTQSVYDKTVILGGNQGFEDGLTGWGPLSAVPPGPFSDPNGNAPIHYASYQGRSGVAVVTPGMGRRNIYTDKLFPIDTSRKYRLRTWIYVGPGGASRTYVGFRTLNASSVTVGSNGGHQYSAVGGILDPENTGWKEYVSGVLTGEGVGGFNAGTRQIQLCAFLNYAGVNGTSLVNTAIDGIWLEDVTESEAAKAQATASATSASNAAASSTTAGQQAAAAQTAKTAAETAKGLAETAASQASSSATNAAGSASTASTAATNAATSRDQASGFATAASGSASTASTKATEAGNSAAAAAASQVSASAAKDAAKATAITLLPSTITKETHTTATPGNPLTVADLSASQVVNGTFESSSSGAIACFKGLVPWEAGRIWEVSIEVEVKSGTAPTSIAPYVRPLSNTFTAFGSAENYSFGTAPVGETTKRVVRFGMGVLPPPAPGVTSQKINAIEGLSWLRFGALFNRSAPSATSVLKSLVARDVTAQVAAESSASASATSASSAGASATTAGEKATAASGSATVASTKAGEASTFASQASTSSASAITAASNAGASATSAAGSATAAEGFSVTASGHMLEAKRQADLILADGEGTIKGRLTDVESITSTVDGRTKAMKTVASNVNGVITGTQSINDGVSTSFKVQTDIFELVPSTGTGRRLHFSNGNLILYDDAGRPRIYLGVNL